MQKVLVMLIFPNSQGTDEESECVPGRTMQNCKLSRACPQLHIPLCVQFISSATPMEENKIA